MCTRHTARTDLAVSDWAQALTTVKLLLVSASLQLQLSRGASCADASALACAHKFWLSGYLFCSLQWSVVSIPTSQVRESKTGRHCTLL